MPPYCPCAQGHPVSLTSSGAPNSGEEWLSPPIGIHSLRSYIKCFNKSLIFHTSCLFTINLFSNFTKKKKKKKL